MHEIAYEEIHDEMTDEHAILMLRGSANGGEAPLRVINGSKTQLIGHTNW